VIKLKIFIALVNIATVYQINYSILDVDSDANILIFNSWLRMSIPYSSAQLIVFMFTIN